MRKWIAGVVLPIAVLSGGTRSLAAPAASKSGPETARFTSVVKAKPLSENAKRGLAWLAKTQDDSGGWAQGEESAYMGHSLDQVKDKPNVGDTCMAALALLRAGNTPSKGAYAKNVRRAVEFVCGRIEESDPKSLSVTDVQGTRLQMKLGTYIDTFLASLLLAEVKGRMPNAKSEKRIAAALRKAMDKIERNQRADGTWDNRGWAPALAQSMASKALNRAAQGGYQVDEKVRVKAETYARKQFDQKTGKFSAAGSAGVELYGAAAPLSAMQDSENTNATREAETRAKLKAARSAAERSQAQQELSRIQSNRQDLDQARKATLSRLDDPNFLKGFGSNGGEEFLSYMNIGESLVVKGGQDWQHWDKSMTANLNRIQNKDGTWTGHHCITGRTFCTSAALLALMTDRVQVPLASKIGRR